MQATCTCERAGRSIMAVAILVPSSHKGTLYRVHLEALATESCAYDIIDLHPAPELARKSEKPVF